MKGFVLDAKPNFGECKVSLKDGINDFEYTLRSVKGNGCYLSVWQNGLEKDCITFTKTDLKALFLLLNTEK